MNKKIKILAFRTDRIGDLINSSSFFKSLNNYYDNAEIDLVCSSYNCEIAKRYDFIKNVYIYNKNQNIVYKIIFFLKMILVRYDICIVIDGKTISKFISLFIRSKKKYIICFKKIRSLLGIKFTLFRPSLFLCRLFYSKYVVCDEDYDNKIANIKFNNHYLSMYYYLLKTDDIQLVPSKHIFVINKNSQFAFDRFFDENIKNDFVCIHIDYKWDKYSFNINEFNSFLRNISFKKKIVITSGIEGSSFFNRLKNYHSLYIFKNDDLFNNLIKSPNIMLIENLSIDLLACFLKKCNLSISSHSGATVHIAAAFDIPVIDFIMKSKANEYDRWIPPNIDYNRVFIDKLINLENLINTKI